MKQYLRIVPLLYFLASCTPYQYLTVSGIDVNKQEKTGFVFETDTLRVQYTFSGYRGRVGITIQNKTDQWLEVDWQKSALILNGEAFSLYKPGASFNGTISSDSATLLTRLISPGVPDFTSSMAGSININESSQFIPPVAFISKAPLALPLNMIPNLPKGEPRVLGFQQDHGWQVYYRSLLFDKTASPVQFKILLTFRYGNGSGRSEFSLVHHFFVSEIWKTNANPKKFPDGFFAGGDLFFL